jgi:hypothetical protein
MQGIFWSASTVERKPTMAVVMLFNRQFGNYPFKLNICRYKSSP